MEEPHQETMGVQAMVNCLLKEAVSRIEQKHKCKALEYALAG